MTAGLSEQEVRTQAGWIGVEISKSRVRMPGKLGFGLYRVRGLERYNDQDSRIGQWSDDLWRPTEWTPYVCTLAAIGLAVQNSIQGGVPAGPVGLMVERADWVPDADFPPYVTVPTRWTSAYRGKRNLGEAYLARIGRDLAGLETDDPQVRRTAGRLAETKADIVQGTTVRQRQRASNATFQAEHKVRREHGLERRHAHKLSLPKCPVTGDRCSRCASAAECSR